MTEARNFKRVILIVDDDQAVRDTLSKALRFDGHVVTSAADGPEALSIFEPKMFDLVFTDLKMPGMAGDKVAAEIKRRAPTQAVVAVTAHVQNLRDALVPWFDDYIGKPFTLKDLRDLIEKYAPA